MEYNGIQFLRPDPFLSEGITFLRHDPDWRPYYIPLQTRLTKRHSDLTPFSVHEGLHRSGPRMGFAVGLLQPIQGDVGIHLGRR